MILDSLENLHRYMGFEKIKDFDLNRYANGRFEIDGENFFGIGLEYETKDSDKCLWEAHRKYIDVHLILEGCEHIEVGDIANMIASTEYSMDGDYQLFQGTASHSFTLKTNDIIILYPNEVHKTAVKVEEATSVKKIVFKIVIT